MEKGGKFVPDDVDVQEGIESPGKVLNHNFLVYFSYLIMFKNNADLIRQDNKF